MSRHEIQLENSIHRKSVMPITAKDRSAKLAPKRRFVTSYLVKLRDPTAAQTFERYAFYRLCHIGKSST